MSAQELTTAQVAEKFGVSPITARLWCRRGLFPNAHEQQTARGPVWMIPESDLLAFDPPKKTGRPPKAKEATKKAAKKGKAK
jgi:uncharacterized protein YjcR